MQVAVQYQDSDAPAGVWNWVWNGAGLIPDGAGNATVVDCEQRFGVTRSYRAMAFVPAPYIAGRGAGRRPRRTTRR